MKRILFVCRHFPPEKSGMATQMYHHVKFLKKYAKLKVVRITNNSEELKHPLVSETIPFRLNLWAELSKLRDDFQPDLVHFDSVWPAGPCITRVFKDTPKAVSVGGLLFDEYKDYYKYTHSNFFIGKLKGVFLHYSAKFVLNRLNVIFAEGNDIKQHLMNGGIKTKIFVINNGIDFSHFKYKRNKGKTVLYFGRYSWENGPDLFLEILKELPDFEGALVGYGPMKEELRLASLRLPNVNVRDPVEFKEIPKLLRSFDFVVLPFRRIGGISQTVTESMVSGKVVLTTRVGDLENVIENGKTGFFFKNVEEARTILQKVSNELKLRRAIEMAASQKIKKDFAWSHVIKKYLQVYNNYLE